MESSTTLTSTPAGKSGGVAGRRLATAAVLGAGSALLMGGVAHADGLYGATPGATKDASKVGLTVDGKAVTPNADLQAIETAANTPNDHLLWTYCIQQGTAVNKKALYDEKGWDTPATADFTANLQGVKWLLNNSFPQRDTASLATLAGISGPLSDVDAVAATQAAVWNLTDASGKTTLDESATTPNDANVIALYNYLQKTAATHLKDSGTPQLSLGISPSTVSGATAGDKIGPFTLTSSDSVTKFVTVVFDDSVKQPAGSKIVDKDGNEVTPTTMLKDGDKVWVQIPAGADAGHILLRASGQLPVMDTGRVFVSHDATTTQNLIVAASQDVYVRDYVDVAWKAGEVTPPTTPTTPVSTSVAPVTTTAPVVAPATPTATPSGPSLAHTGAGNAMALGGGAMALVAAGGGMVLYTRKTKRAGSH